jgi:hypothetical protein
VQVLQEPGTIANVMGILTQRWLGVPSATNTLWIPLPALFTARTCTCGIVTPAVAFPGWIVNIKFTMFGG